MITSRVLFPTRGFKPETRITRKSSRIETTLLIVAFLEVALRLSALLLVAVEVAATGEGKAQTDGVLSPLP